MRYLGFGRAKRLRRYLGFNTPPIMTATITANFATGNYTRANIAVTFADIFNFTRDSVAWLANGTTINEYAKNAPRITSTGLLIEKQSTNYARWSFLPENGEFSRTSNIYWEPAFKLWKKSSSSGSNLYVNSLESLTGDVVGSVCAAAGQGNVSFTRMVFDNGIAATTRLPQTNVFYYKSASGISMNNTGVLWDSIENVATSSAALYFQIEKGIVPTSPIKTTTAPVTRLADLLRLKANAISISGDWDKTLTLSIVNGQLIHTGYGKIRSLSVDYTPN